jgi:hypothetical protein
MTTQNAQTHQTSQSPLTGHKKAKEQFVKTITLFAALAAVCLNAPTAFAAAAKATPAPAKCAKAEVEKEITDIRNSAIHNDICTQADEVKKTFVKLGCDEAKTNAAFLGACPESAKDDKAEPPEIREAVKETKPAKATPKADSSIIAPSPNMNWVLMHPVARSMAWYYLLDRSNNFFTKDMFDSLDTLKYTKQGPKAKERKLFERFSKGGGGDISLFRDNFFDKDLMQKDYVESFLVPNGCKENTDKSYECPGAAEKLAAVQALLTSIPEAKRPNEAKYFCAAKMDGQPIEKQEWLLQYASACFNSLPANIIAYHRLEKNKAGRSLFEGAADSVGSLVTHEVEVCHESGDCYVGTVTGADKEKGIQTEVAKGDVRVVTPTDLLAKTYKVFIGKACEGSDPKIVLQSLEGKPAHISSGGHYSSGIVKKADSDAVEITGIIEGAAGFPISVDIGLLSAYQTGKNDLGVRSASNQIVFFSPGYKFRLGEVAWIEPHGICGLGISTGSYEANQGATPFEKRFFGLIGGGLRIGIDKGTFSPYVVGQGFGLPGPGYSFGIGTTVHTESSGALDLSLAWTHLPTEVLSGFRSPRIETSGLGFAIAWKL